MERDALLKLLNEQHLGNILIDGADGGQGAAKKSGIKSRSQSESIEDSNRNKERAKRFDKLLVLQRCINAEERLVQNAVQSEP